MKIKKTIITLLCIFSFLFYGCLEPEPELQTGTQMENQNEKSDEDENPIDESDKKEESDEVPEEKTEIKKPEENQSEQIVKEPEAENKNDDNDGDSDEKTEEEEVAENPIEEKEVTVTENEEEQEPVEENVIEDEESEEVAEEIVEEVNLEAKPVTFSITGDVEYEAVLELFCETSAATIYYSYSEFSPEDYSSQKKYTKPIILTSSGTIYAISVNKTVTSDITQADFSICNAEELCFGVAEVYRDEDCTLLSEASNLTKVEENNLAVILGNDVKITVTKNDATQPENWIDSWRFYYTSREGKLSNSISITSSTKKFKKILFESTNYTQGKFTVDNGEFDTKKGIWCGSSDSLVFTPTANAQLKKITVVYETEL